MIRGQAALEYLTTYGWAFLVILVMLGAIGYFGLMNTQQYVPEQCKTPPEFGCEDYQLHAESDESRPEVSIFLKNNGRDEIWVTPANLSYEDQRGNTYCGTLRPAEGAGGVSWVTFDEADPNTYLQVSPGGSFVINCNEGAGESIYLPEDAKAKVDFFFRYMKSEDGFLHRVDGEVIATVQP